MTETLHQVRLPYATAGVVVRDGRVVEAAPILRWAVGRSITDLSRWVAGKGGAVVEVAEAVHE